MRILIFSDHRGNERFFLRVPPNDYLTRGWAESSVWSSCKAEMHYGVPSAAFDLLDKVRDKAQSILDRY